jgi:hypothetical protein
MQVYVDGATINQKLEYLQKAQLKTPPIVSFKLW